jgi:hypothetical protein
VSAQHRLTAPPTPHGWFVTLGPTNFTGHAWEHRRKLLSAVLTEDGRLIVTAYTSGCAPCRPTVAQLATASEDFGLPAEGRAS